MRPPVVLAAACAAAILCLPATGQAQAPAGADGPAAIRLQRLREADAEVRASSQALEQARAQLRDGKEPLPGERTGNVGGGSRLNEAYWARQAANEKAVAEAQARLDRAVAELNALR